MKAHQKKIQESADKEQELTPVLGKPIKYPNKMT
jgi:hypothetical protein